MKSPTAVFLARLALGILFCLNSARAATHYVNASGTGPVSTLYDAQETLGYHATNYATTKGQLKEAEAAIEVLYQRALAWPDGDHNSRLVFITRNISEPQVRDLLASVRALATPPGS